MATLLNRRRYMGGGTSPTPTWKSYIQNGLVACWDGEANTGNTHDANATNWIDCVSGIVLAGTNASWGENYANFDGTTRYIASDNNAKSAISNLYAEAVFMTTDPSAFQIVLMSDGKRIIGLNTSVLAISGGKTGDRNGFSPITTSDIVSLSINYNTWGLYKNGVEQSPIGKANNGAALGDYRVGVRNNSGFSGFFKGKLYSLRFYNRALSSSEIAMNFNIDKKRFGI